MKIRSLAIVIAASVVWMACASSPDMADADVKVDTAKNRYTAAPGPSPVGAIPDVVLRDNERNRDVSMSIEYPTKPGPHPLIIFSHGFGGSQRAYVGLSAHWASYGYVVIKPTHADGAAPSEARTSDEMWSSQTQTDWRNRVRDITFVLDSLDALEKQYPELQGKIDRTKVGVGGHSYGAFTAMLVGGAKTFPGGVSYADPRVKAIIAMSPQGPSDVRGLTRESFATISVPALFMTGTLDKTSDVETPEWRQQAYELAGAGDKWLVSIEGASHGSFTGRMDQIMEMRATERRPDALDPTTRDPYNPRTTSVTPRPRTRGESMMFREREIFRRIQSLSLAFWDAYLRADNAGREALENANGTDVTVATR